MRFHKPKKCICTGLLPDFRKNKWTIFIFEMIDKEALFLRKCIIWSLRDDIAWEMQFQRLPWYLHRIVLNLQACFYNSCSLLIPHSAYREDWEDCFAIEWLHIGPNPRVKQFGLILGRISTVLPWTAPAQSAEQIPSQHISLCGPDATTIGVDLNLQMAALMNCSTGKVAVATPQVNEVPFISVWSCNLVF